MSAGKLFVSEFTGLHGIKSMMKERNFSKHDPVLFNPLSSLSIPDCIVL